MTSIFNTILLSVIQMASTIDLYSPIVIGALPADNGISCAISTGSPVSVFQDKSMTYQIDVVLNGKHSDQQTVSDTLNNIHIALTQTKNYPNAADFQITDISTVSLPSYLDREENKQYLYGSSLTVKFYLR